MIFEYLPDDIATAVICIYHAFTIRHSNSNETATIISSSNYCKEREIPSLCLFQVPYLILTAVLVLRKRK